MKAEILKPFDWAHRGVEIQSYEAGMEIETDDADLIEVGTREGWLKEVDKKAAADKAAADKEAADKEAAKKTANK